MFSKSMFKGWNLKNILSVYKRNAYKSTSIFNVYLFEIVKVGTNKLAKSKSVCSINWTYIDFGNFQIQNKHSISTAKRVRRTLPEGWEEEGEGYGMVSQVRARAKSNGQLLI